MREERARFESYLAGLRERREADGRALEARRARALEEARAAAARLGRAGARRVWLFGSLAGGAFDERSDIDLAVEGLAPGTLGDAWAAANMGSSFEIEVVPIDAARDSIRASIGREGKLIWEAGGGAERG
jgi:predicted nucleotidyltransferase